MIGKALKQVTKALILNKIIPSNIPAIFYFFFIYYLLTLNLVFKEIGGVQKSLLHQRSQPFNLKVQCGYSKFGSKN